MALPVKDFPAARLLGPLAAALALGVPLQSSANACPPPDKPVHFFLQGRVASAALEGPGDPGGVAQGDLVTLELAFCPGTPDANPDPGFGLYEAIAAAQLTVGALNWTWDGTGAGAITVVNGDSDAYDLFLGGLAGTPEPTSVRLTLLDSTGSALSSEALPAAPPDLLAFDRTVFTVRRVPQQISSSLERLELDACPFHSSPNNADRNANGIGDECECGDQNGDGRVDVLDIVAINLAIFGQVPVSPLCDTNFDGRCNVSDIVGVNHRIFGAPAYCSRHPPPAP